MQLLGRYTVIENLTASPNAEVYRVLDGSDAVVVKMIRDTSFARRELLINQRLMASNPRHIVRLLRYHEEENWLYMVFEEFGGNLLAEPAKPRLLLFFLLDSARGLVEMYRAGVIHDDIKPENSLIKNRNGSKRFAFCDFGGARFIGEPASEMTTDFMSPELMEGKTSDRTAIYSWALTIERYCTGRIGRPRVGLNIAGFVPWVGWELGKLLIQCCARDPGQRPSADDVLTGVTRIAELANRNIQSDGIIRLP